MNIDERMDIIQMGQNNANVVLIAYAKTLPVDAHADVSSELNF